MADASLRWRAAIASYFDAAAADYAAAIAPIFSALARGLVQLADLHPGMQVLDLGTGMGAAGLEAARSGVFVVGLDRSRGMLAYITPQRGFVSLQGDFHELPFRTGNFDICLASFAFNSSDPELVARESYRVLAAGGLLLLQEWGKPDDLSEMISDTVAEYSTNDPPPGLRRLREQLAEPLPWDNIDSVDTLVDLIRTAGFTAVDVNQARTTVDVALPNLLRYKLAWPIRQAELAAMSPEMRELCLSDLRENLEPFAGQDGEIQWQPEIVQIVARKPV